jgi:hypothetical protein
MEKQNYEIKARIIYFKNKTVSGSSFLVLPRIQIPKYFLLSKREAEKLLD